MFNVRDLIVHTVWVDEDGCYMSSFIKSPRSLAWLIGFGDSVEESECMLAEAAQTIINKDAIDGLGAEFEETSTWE